MTCAGCGKTLDRPESRTRNQRHYCSVACRRNRVRLVCEWCGTEFEIAPSHAKAKRHYCSIACYHAGGRRLTGRDHGSWRGGRREYKGYVMVHVALLSGRQRELADQMRGTLKYLLEHRLVMAVHLDRPLLPTEQVHHKNRIKSDNRIENLELLGGGAHSLTHAAAFEQVRRLEIENAALRSRIAELEAGVG